MRACTTVTASTGICTGRLYIIGRSIINSPFLISRYDYIANIDTDEIFVPRHPFKNWVEMMQNVSSSHPGHSDYSFISYYIFEQTLSRKGYFVDIPEYLYMLQNIHRSSNYVPRGKHTILNTRFSFIFIFKERYWKTFINTEKAKYVWNHESWRYIF